MFCRQPRSLHLIVRAIVVVAGLAVALPAVSAPEPPGYAEIFTRAFSPDFSATVDDALLGEGPRLVTVYFKVIDLGRLKITSGHIVAADPFIGTNNAAFTQKVPTGEFPVELAILQGSMGKRRVAFARVAFSGNATVGWSLAVRPADQPGTMKPDEILGYPVESGTGGFFDRDAGKAAAQRMKEDDQLIERWLDQGIMRGAKERGTGFHVLEDIGPANVAAFDSGWGDGVYASWFGYDAEGNVTVLLTDFDIIDWSKAKW